MLKSPNVQIEATPANRFGLIKSTSCENAVCISPLEQECANAAWGYAVMRCIQSGKHFPLWKFMLINTAHVILHSAGCGHKAD